MNRLRGYWNKFENAIGGFTRIQWNKSRKFIRKFYSGQHQLTSTTSENRYPEIFRYAQESLKSLNGEEIRILSYGCSTGEECFTIRRYFPTAAIIGVDINTKNLKKAKKKNIDKRIKFLFSNDDNIKEEGKYTLIFCLSVLCRWEDTKDMLDCSRIYPFERFEQTILKLVDQLENGGLLVLYNSNFRFEDTSAYSQFDIVPTPDTPDSGFVHKFDSNNKRIVDIHKHCIYKKKYGDPE